MRKLVSISNREVELIRTENVYSTTDYSIFNISEMNRIIKLGNVKQHFIKWSAKTNNY